MNAIINSPDLANKISQRDLMISMSLMGTLPSRTSETPETLLASYWISLEGISKFGLESAVKAILRGALNHTFFPSPVEIRQEVAKAEAPIRDAHFRAATLARQAEDDARLKSVRENITPEARARVSALVSRFNTETEKAKELADAPLVPDDTPFDRANRMFDRQSKLGAVSFAPEKISPNDPRLADVPNASEPYGWRKLKGAA